MKRSRPLPILVAAIAFGAISGRACIGQEFKKGDEVIALRGAALQVEAKTVGTVSKGDTLVVDEVQDEWLWVRSGDIQGWIGRNNVEPASNTGYALRFKAPWGTLYETGKKDGAYYLRVAGGGPEASGDQPTLLAQGKLAGTYIASHLAIGHKDATLGEGELSASYEPKNRTLHFAVRTSGRVEWFGHILDSGKDGRLVFFSSVDRTGALSKWYFNMFGAGADIPIPRIAVLDDTGWIGSVATTSQTVDFDNRVAKKPEKRQEWSPRYVFHCSKGSFLLHIYPQTALPREGLAVGEQHMYRVQGYFGTNPNPDDAGNPFLPDTKLIVIPRQLAAWSSTSR
jgi:hypothetical protein